MPETATARVSDVFSALRHRFASRLMKQGCDWTEAWIVAGAMIVCGGWCRRTVREILREIDRG